LPARLPHIYVFALELECRGSRDQAQGLGASQRIRDFVGQTVGEVFVRRVATQVDEGEHDDGGLKAGGGTAPRPKQDRRNRNGNDSRSDHNGRSPSEGGRLGGRRRLDQLWDYGGGSDAFKPGRVSALRDADEYRVELAAGPVVLGQLKTQLPRIHPNHGVGFRIIGFWALKDIQPDAVFLEVPTVAGQRFFHYIRQEPAQARRSSEKLARQDGLKLLPDRFRGRFQSAAGL
jgi:hypothetical protein